MLVTVLAALLVASAPAPSAATSPVSKVIQLLSNLEAKITKEGDESQNTFREFTFWCEDRSKNLAYDIKTNTAAVESLTADIEQASSSLTSLGAKIDDTAAAISTDEADLKAASGIREKDAADYAVEHKELQDVVGALGRAIGVLEREAQEGGAAMLQVQKAKSVAEMLRIMVDASMLQSQDASKLTALVQGTQEAPEGAETQAEDDALAAGTPEAAAYENQSGNVIDVLKDLLDKARDELGEAQKKEMNSRHNFEMLKQSLDDEIRFSTKQLNEAKQATSLQKEAKANAEGDLSVTSKTLAQDKATTKTLKHDCMTKSQDFAAEMKGRGEELQALAAAKKALVENTGGAANIAYGSSSFVQVRAVKFTQSGLKTAADLANIEVVHFIRNLAREQHSDELMQLYRNMASVARAGADTGVDPFKKVTGLIKDMLHRLTKEGQADATHKAYCDKEMGETMEKKADKEANIDKLTIKIDGMSAKSAQLKEQVAGLQNALAEIASSQKEMTALRHKEKAQFEKNKAETTQGLDGVKVALQVLREYYSQGDMAHSAAEGAANGIVGLLEVVQSDFSMSLAEMSATENSAARDYEQETNENQIEKATKQQDVRYKTKEFRGLDNAMVEASSDRQGVQAELTAILEYKGHLIQMCVAMPATYDERQSRRAAEIAGLKEALKILSSPDVALLQRTGAGQRFRGRASLAA